MPSSGCGTTRRPVARRRRCVLFEGGDEAVTTGDILHAIGQTRRTLTPELVTEFEQDIEDYARV